MTSPKQPATTVRDAVYGVMRSFGANKIFGNPGSTELPMFKDFPSDFEYVLGLQEAVVVGTADGYAQATGQIAFVNLHSAAGVGNAMGNIHTAFKNCTPLVIIAGQQARSILQFDSFLASDQATELPKPYIKWSVEPARAEDVPQAVATACRIALQSPSGPVLVSVPSDDWDMSAAPVVSRESSRSVRPDPAILAKIAKSLRDAVKPAFVVGAEVDRDDAWEEIVELAERHSAAVFVSPMSARCSFPEDHPLFMGFLPAARDQIVTRLAAYDLVFVVGAPIFVYHMAGDGPHITPGTTVCHVTEDMRAAARAPIGTSAVCGVKLGLRDLLLDLRGAALKFRSLPSPRPAAPKAEPSDPITTAFVLQTLAEIREPSHIFVEEAPTARVVMHVHLPMLQPQTFFTGASGGLGYGMAAAVGVALAKPGRKVIALIGDGSTMYSVQALWTAAQLGLNVTYIVLNNRRYAAMIRWGGVLGFPQDKQLPGTDLSGLDFVALANGHGCAGTYVKSPAELRAALKSALDTVGPTLVEVAIA